MTQGFTKELPLSTDETLSGNSDQYAVSEAAIKAYVDSKFPRFQRNLTADLTLEDGECLVITGYLNAGSFSVTLNGDAEIHIL